MLEWKNKDLKKMNKKICKFDGFLYSTQQHIGRLKIEPNIVYIDNYSILPKVKHGLVHFKCNTVYFKGF